MRALFFCFVLALFAIGCQRPPKYPDAPTIKFESITSTPIVDTSGTISTNVEIQISFSDGTGDLGLTQEDTVGIYRNILDSIKTDKKYFKFNRNSKNYWTDSYVKRDGKYILLKAPEEYLANSLDFYLNDDRFRPFNDQYLSNNTPIEGLLNYKFNIGAVLNSSTITVEPELVDGDTMKFEVRILDRKLNISNTITTPDVVISLFLK